MSSSSSQAAPSAKRHDGTLVWSTLLLVLGVAGAIFLAAEALVLACLVLVLPYWLQILFWAQWLVFAVLLNQVGAFKVFGPVMVYDLVRASRRKRYLFLRILYLTALLLLACWVFGIWMLGTRDWTLNQEELSAFSLSFFSIFVGVQFLTVVILTPAYVAGSISEEKERKTMEFLLATDLRSTEIVLGKFASRLANLQLLLIAGLPVLSAFQFLGGVDPNLVLASFAATFLTATSLGAVGIFFSVMLRKSRDAIALTYIVFAVYMAVSGAFQVLRLTPLSALTVPGTDGWLEPITFSDFLTWLGAGNPILAVYWLFQTAGPARSLHLDESLPWILRNYSIFHGILSVSLPLWATLRLRHCVLSEQIVSQKKKSRQVEMFPKPAVGRWPVLWKELFVERGMRFHWVARIAVGLLVVLSFLPVVFIFWYTIVDPPWGSRGYSSEWDNFGRGMNVWVRFVGPIVGCLTLLGVAVRAAGSITGEKAKNTWDELLTSPLSSQQILFGKFLGAFAGVRWGFAWLVAVWLVAVLTGGMVPMALPALVAAWFSYAALLAVLGLWFSMNSRNTLIATIVTLLFTLLISVGHWLVTTVFIYMPMMILRVNLFNSRGFEEVAKWFVSMQIGMTPPVVLGMLAARWEEIDITKHWVRDTTLRFITASILGAAVWAIAAAGFYILADFRFRRLTNRVPFRRRPAPQPRVVPANVVVPVAQASEGNG